MVIYYVRCLHLIIICFTTVLPTNVTIPEQLNNSLQFQWLQSDNRFDCIVGIAAGDKPIGIGILVYEDFIVTSANPLEAHLQKDQTSDKYTDPNNTIKFHIINGAFNKSKILNIGVITGNIAKRHDVWIRMGFDKTHSPIHDLMVIKISEGQVMKPPGTMKREAFYLAPDFKSYFTSGWTFAGFGYESSYHIFENTMLEMTLNDDSEVADCDEWIPRAWGRFICLMNIEKLEGVQSGAPLIHEGVLRGIGSFALQKGKESILVFTDYKLYTLLSDHKNSTENNTRT